MRTRGPGVEAERVVGRQELVSATAAYMSGRGYLVSIGVEVPHCEHCPDVFAMRIRSGELALRREKGGAPTGLTGVLSKEEWKSPAVVAKETGYPVHFLRGVLRESEERGWVESSVGEDGEERWRLAGYRFPAKECILLQCAVGDADRSFELIEGLSGCFNKGYIVFPYQVDGKTTAYCAGRGLGLWVFNRKIVRFEEVVPARRFELANTKSAASICERIIVEQCALGGRV